MSIETLSESKNRDYKKKLFNMLAQEEPSFCQERIFIWKKLSDDLLTWINILSAVNQPEHCKRLIESLSDDQLFKFSEGLKDVELDICVHAESQKDFEAREKEINERLAKKK